MIIEKILSPSAVLYNIPGSSKKKVLENVADSLQNLIDELDNTEIFESLIAREKLGSTAIGKGIAIPHCRSASIEHIIGCLVKLQEPINFDAPDDLPVDVLFVMLVPEQATDEHLQTLAQLAQLFEQSEFRNALRKAKNCEELYNAAIQFDKAA